MKLSPKTLACITLLVYWGPFNALYYFWGFILFFFIFFSKKEWMSVKGVYSKRIVTGVLLFFIVFIISASVNFFVHRPSLNNTLWSMLTYGSSFFVLLALLAIPFKAGDLKGIFKFSLYLTLFQVFLGYFQMLEVDDFHHINPFNSGMSTGDFFVGTTFDPGIGSFVAIKMSLMTLLFIPVWMGDKSIKNSIILLLLFVGWVLASALFTLLLGVIVIFLFFLVKKLLMLFYSGRVNKSVFYVVIAGALGVIIFVFTQGNNIAYFFNSLKHTYATVMGINIPGMESARKVIYYRKTLTELPAEYPSAVLIGVGPGNYSSRSAWLVSGEYLKTQPYYIQVTPSDIASKYAISVWSKDMITPEFKGAGSITHQPFSTWLSVFAEMGIFALLVFFALFRTFYKGMRNTANVTSDPLMLQLGLGLRICIVYISLLFFMDNLFEYPLVMGQFFVFACAMVKAIENEMKGDNSSPAAIS